MCTSQGLGKPGGGVGNGRFIRRKMGSVAWSEARCDAPHRCTHYIHSHARTHASTHPHLLCVTPSPPLNECVCVRGCHPKCFVPNLPDLAELCFSSSAHHKTGELSACGDTFAVGVCVRVRTCARTPTHTHARHDIFGTQCDQVF